MIDLHMHSTFSLDSRDEPEGLVDDGYANGVRVVSITEHENIDSLGRARTRAEELGMTYVSGVEMGARLELDGKRYPVHILGYFFDDAAPGIRALDQKVRRSTLLNAAKVMEGFQLMDVPLTQADVEAKYPGRFSTWAIRRFMREAGMVQNKPEGEALVEEALAKAGGGAKDGPDLRAENVLHVLKSDGAQTYMAHPFWLRKPSRGEVSEDLIWRQIEAMLELGVDGLEAINFVSDPGYHEQVLAYCKQHNIPASGGSDSHGIGAVGKGQAGMELFESMQRKRRGETTIWP